MRENAGQLRENCSLPDPVRFLVEAVCFAHDSHEHQKLMLRQTRTHDSFKELIGDARKPSSRPATRSSCSATTGTGNIDYLGSICHNYPVN